MKLDRRIVFQPFRSRPVQMIPAQPHSVHTDRKESVQCLFRENIDVKNPFLRKILFLHRLFRIAQIEEIDSSGSSADGRNFSVFIKMNDLHRNPSAQRAEFFQRTIRKNPVRGQPKTVAGGDQQRAGNINIVNPVSRYALNFLEPLRRVLKDKQSGVGSRRIDGVSGDPHAADHSPAFITGEARNLFCAAFRAHCKCSRTRRQRPALRNLRNKESGFLSCKIDDAVSRHYSADAVGHFLISFRQNDSSGDARIPPVTHIDEKKSIVRIRRSKKRSRRTRRPEISAERIKFRKLDPSETLGCAGVGYVEDLQAVSGAFPLFLRAFSGIVTGGGVKNIFLNINAVPESVKFDSGKLLRPCGIGCIKQKNGGVAPVSDSKNSVRAVSGLRLEGPVQVEMFRLNRI